MKSQPAGSAPRPTAAPAPAPAPASAEKDARAARERDPNREFLRAENEDDDGYDPYSDRRPAPEPLFERDPWA